MTPTYSGGFIFQYSREAGPTAPYGLMDLTVSPPVRLSEFSAAASAFASAAPPHGDGGFRPHGHPSACPKESAVWRANTSLPVIPEGAQSYMDGGAGRGRGKVGNSQWEGTASASRSAPLEEGQETDDSLTVLEGKKDGSMVNITGPAPKQTGGEAQGQGGIAPIQPKISVACRGKGDSARLLAAVGGMTIAVMLILI